MKEQLREQYEEAERYLIDLGWKAHIGRIEEKAYTYPELIEVVIETIKKAKEEEKIRIFNLSSSEYVEEYHKTINIIKKLNQVIDMKEKKEIYESPIIPLQIGDIITSKLGFIMKSSLTEEWYKFFKQKYLGNGHWKVIGNKIDVNVKLKSSD